MNYRRIGRWAAAAAGVAVAGAGLYWLREKRIERPASETLRSDPPFELRRYPALLTAETVQKGTRDRALGNGFGLLADYIFAEGREGEEIAMTAPVLSEQEPGGAWRIRFIMPAEHRLETLPKTGPGVDIATLPEAQVAVVKFSGKVDDAILADRTAALTAWIERQGLTAAGRPRFAFYNSPFIPGAIRANEVWIPVSEA